MKRLIIIGSITVVLIGAMFVYKAVRHGGGDRYWSDDGRMKPPPHEQFDGFGPGGPGGKGRFGDGPMDVLRYEKLRLRKALEMLDLDEATEETFREMYRKHHRTMKELFDKRLDSIDELRKAIRDDKTTNDEYDRIIERVRATETEIFNEIQNRMNKFESILNKEQLARLYIFQARFDKEIVGKMREKRGRRFRPDPQDSI